MRTNLIKRRKELKLTQKQVADQLGVNQITIGRFERGETDLSSETFIQYLHILKLDYSARIDAIERELERIDIRMKENDKTIAKIDKLIDKLLES